MVELNLVKVIKSFTGIPFEITLIGRVINNVTFCITWFRMLKFISAKVILLALLLKTSIFARILLLSINRAEILFNETVKY